MKGQKVRGPPIPNEEARGYFTVPCQFGGVYRSSPWKT